MSTSDEELKIIDQEYQEKFKSELVALQGMGIDDASFKKFNQFIKRNKFNFINIDESFIYEEQFLNIDSAAWKRVSAMVSSKVDDKTTDMIFDFLATKMKEYTKNTIKELIESLIETLGRMRTEFQYKENKTPNQLAFELIVAGLSFPYVENAYIKLVNKQYSAVIKYVAFNKNFDVKLTPTEHYDDFKKYNAIKLNNYKDHFVREFNAWFYNWDNILEVTKNAISASDLEDFNKLFSKTLVGDFI